MKINRSRDGSAVITEGPAKVSLDKGDACTLARVQLMPKASDWSGDIDRMSAVDVWFDEQYGSQPHDGFPLPSFCDLGDQVIADVQESGQTLAVTFGRITGFEDDRYGTEIWEQTAKVILGEAHRLRLFADLAGASLDQIEAWWRAEYGANA